MANQSLLDLDHGLAVKIALFMKEHGKEVSNTRDIVAYFERRGYTAQTILNTIIALDASKVLRIAGFTEQEWRKIMETSKKMRTGRRR